ncbi:hypothetical protein BDR06DRAFT_433861 [Suillus hirtellus]|nr:hypothetical protein BDR06DRAFT_433861 [Suillus hirtellus]
MSLLDCQLFFVFSFCYAYPCWTAGSFFAFSFRYAFFCWTTSSFRFAQLSV